MDGAVNEMANFNGMAALETRSSCCRRWTRSVRRIVQPLRGGLGVGDGHAVPVDQAGRFPLGRHPQRDHRALAERDRGDGWAAHAVQPRDRRRADDPGGGWLPEPTVVNGVQQSPMEGTSMLYSFNDADARRNGTTCSTSRCSPTAASTTRAGARSPSTARRGSWSAGSCRPSTMTSGSSMTAARLTPGSRPRRPSMPDMLAKLQRLCG